jgi:hypothetical protein
MNDGPDTIELLSYSCVKGVCGSQPKLIFYFGWIMRTGDHGQAVGDFKQSSFPLASSPEETFHNLVVGAQLWPPDVVCLPYPAFRMFKSIARNVFNISQSRMFSPFQYGLNDWMPKPE